MGVKLSKPAIFIPNAYIFFIEQKSQDLKRNLGKLIL
jgi:hypothetical protein